MSALTTPLARRRLAALGIVVLLGTGVAVWSWPRGRAVPPLPDLHGRDAEVVQLIEQTHREVLAEPRSASAWGRLGMVLRAHNFGAEANVCFAEAERLDPGEPRWPYFHGL